ncbi:gustatory receptor 5a for trehalose-like [Manduca sexta]|uniref:gustatory receptor 5a for trehalose-like n=1 Tax=Manduca sexta TaxID=7130 RepID=UPI0011844038|nr:gustatory receptor 5a for trehalose-like [Manduca sexta]
MSKLFQFSCWFGVSGYGKPIWRAWTSVLVILLLFIEGVAIWKVVKALAGWAVDTVGHRSVTARLAGTMFYFISIMSIILCSRLSYSWRNLSKYWASVERAVAINIPEDVNIKKRLIFVIAGMAFCTFSEHLTNAVTLVGFECPPSEILKQYTLLSHGFMIMEKDFSEWYVIPLVYLSIIATILWTFHDLLIILISIGLTSRYNRLNRYVAHVCELENKGTRRHPDVEIVSIYTWRKIREAYVKQALLVRKMDDELGGLIMLSSLCNFYFICLQLFMAITQDKVTTLRRIYYFVSLGWLCIRVGGVVLAASAVNVRSKAALQYIYGCDANIYNIEVRRLQGQLAKDYIALTGMGFFSLNKNILLQVNGRVNNNL